MIAFACAGCGRELLVPGEPADTQARCPDCGRVNPCLPPAASETATPPPGAPELVEVTGPWQATAPPDAAAGPERVSVAGYEVLSELGRGGTGGVYKARQAGLQRLVALKMILSGAHAGPDDLARFRTEAEAVARLQHPNIVQIHEVGEHAGKPFFSLEFCGGGSLDRKLRGTPQPPAEAAELVRTLARATHAAHQANVIHRDLKPANVLLAADGTPKITDFGLAKKLDDAGQTQSGAIVGTPSYMAPEQAGGKSKEIGPATDVYALGAILYEMLTGRAPFKSATPLDTILQVLSADPVPPTRLQPKCPRDLETICLKCFQKEPRRRYAGALDLADDLSRFPPDGVTPLTLSGNYLRIWDREGKPVGVPIPLPAGVTTSISPQGHPLPYQPISNGLGCTPDGRTLLVKGPNEVRLWDLATGQAIGGPLHNGLLFTVAVSPDSKTVVMGGNQQSAQLWDASRGRPRGEPLRHQGTVYAGAFSPDGRAVLTGSADNTARLWDTVTGAPLGPPLRHPREVEAVAFSPDGKSLLTSSGDRSGRGHEVCLWKMPSLPDLNVERLERWAEVTLGLELDPTSAVLPLGAAALQERWRRLQELGGPPGMSQVPLPQE